MARRRIRLQGLRVRHHGAPVHRLRAHLVADGVRPEDVASIKYKTARASSSTVGAACGQAESAQRLRRQVRRSLRDRGRRVTRRRRPDRLRRHRRARPRGAGARGKVHYVVDPDNPYPRQFTGHVRVTLKSGEVREASQGHFHGGREEPMSPEALEAKFTANCIYGGWDAPRAQGSRRASRATHSAEGRPDGVA